MQVVLVYFDWFRRNSLLKCALQPKITKNSLKTPILGVQGHSRSSMLVLLENSSTVLVMISSKSASICSFFHARWANSCKITISKGGTPLWCPRSSGISSPSGTKITSFETRYARLSYGEDPESLSHSVVSAPGRDRRTDGQNRHS